jgi:hypothetical protein
MEGDLLSMRFASGGCEPGPEYARRHGENGRRVSVRDWVRNAFTLWNERLRQEEERDHARDLYRYEGA